MKLYGVIALLFTLALFAACSADAGEGWVNALKPAGKTVTFIAAKDGEAKCVILIPQTPLPTETKAAEELSTWLGKIANIELPVLRESSNKLNGQIISLGNTQLAQNSDLGALSKGIKDEGYSIISKDGNMFLLGGKRRGPLYAVYALLEEDLGCRWYTQRCDDVIPTMDDLVIKFVPRKYNPVFETRMPGVYEAFDIDWMLKNKVNPFMFGAIPSELGGSTEALGGAHTFFRLLSPDEYFATHPEYFSEIGGKRQASQLCLSNPDVAKIVTAKVKEMFRNSSAKYVAISPMDGMPLCQCAKCKAIDDAQGTKMGSLLTFLNKVGVGIRDEFPDRRILTLAYLDYYYPPKTIKAERNVTIQLCTDSHAWAYPFCTVDETDKFQKALALWHKTGADIVIWDYVNNYDHNLMSFPNMEVVGLDMKFQASHGAGGMFLQGDCWSKGTDSGYMRAWVWAKQLWNPKLDTFKLMKDFIYGYYGAAADNIWQYEMLKDKLWSDNHKKPHNIRKDPKTTVDQNPLMVPGIRWAPTEKLYTPEFMTKATDLMESALKSCKTGGELRKVRAVKLQVDYLRLCKGLGYYNSMKQYFKSDEVLNDDHTNFPKYLALLDDFAVTVSYENVNNFYETYGNWDAPVRIAKWRDLLTKKTVKLPLFPFNDEWKFTTDPDKQGDAKQYYKSDYNDSKWITLMDNIGFGWTSQAFPDYTGIGWYRQTINPPADIASKKHLYMFFGAVDEEAFVYINGEYAFERSFKSTGLPPEVVWNQPFLQDVKGLIKPGQPNTIAVKVNNTANAGGIWQPVYLFSTDEEWTAQAIFDSL